MNTLNFGLQEYWPLWEASGTRYGATGKGNLSDVNTVTQAAGKVGNAASFASASSEYLNVASAAHWQTGAIDFTVAAWVYLASKPAQATIIGKYSTSNEEFTLDFLSASDRFRFGIYQNSGSLATVLADALGSPALNTWYFVMGWRDATANTVNICVNNGNVNSGAATTQKAAGAGAFCVGALSTPSNYWNGRICEAMFHKRILSPLERTYLYNQGNGRSFPFAPSPKPGLSAVATRRIR